MSISGSLSILIYWPVPMITNRALLYLIRRTYDFTHKINKFTMYNHASIVNKSHDNLSVPAPLYLGGCGLGGCGCTEIIFNDFTLIEPPCRFEGRIN